MRAHLIGLAMAATLLALPAAAQAPAPAPAPPPFITFESPSDIAALAAKANAERKPGQNQINEPVLRLAPLAVTLESRIGPTPVAVHETEAELIYVVDGSAEFIVGGTMTGGSRRDPTNLVGTGIDGGVTHQLTKGVWLIVPQGTPHWFRTVNGSLVLITLHIPRSVTP